MLKTGSPRVLHHTTKKWGQSEVAAGVSKKTFAQMNQTQNQKILSEAL